MGYIAMSDLEVFWTAHRLFPGRGSHCGSPDTGPSEHHVSEDRFGEQQQKGGVRCRLRNLSMHKQVIVEGLT